LVIEKTVETLNKKLETTIKTKFWFDTDNPEVFNIENYVMKLCKSHDCLGARRSSDLMNFKNKFVEKVTENRLVPGIHLARTASTETEVAPITFERLRFIGKSFKNDKILTAQD
jgi:hypothetical protein